jgi:hypothetical protein
MGHFPERLALESGTAALYIFHSVLSEIFALAKSRFPLLSLVPSPF